MNKTKNTALRVFQVLLLGLPAVFLLYLYKAWFWFLYPLPTNLLEYATGFVLLFWLIGLWKLKFSKPQFSSKLQVLAVSLFLLSITIVTAKIVLHLNQGRAVPLGIWKGWFMAPATYFMMLISTFRTKTDLKRLIDITLGIISITATVMLIQYATGIFSDITSTYDMRLVWPYLDPLSGLGTSGNYPALFLSPFLCLGWISFIKSRNGLDRSYYLSVILVLIVTIYLTKSYGSWLAVIGACSVASFFVTKGKTKWLLVPFCTILVLAGLYYDQKNTEKFQFGIDTSEELVISSGSERLNIWSVSLDLIKENPIWGVGPGQFQRAFERQAPYSLGRDVSRKEINHALHSHNTFIMFWLSGGIFGILSFVLLLLVLIIPLPREWRWLILTPLLYYLFHGMIDVFYWKNDLAFSFWLFAGMSIISQNLNLVSGTVNRGLKVGRSLGFPTANIVLDLDLDRDFGVYEVILKIEKKNRKGLLYYGPRMTEGLPEENVCEITVINYDGDLYNKNIKFRIGNYIRGPMKFKSQDELKEQIQKDMLVAKHKRFI